MLTLQVTVDICSKFSINKTNTYFRISKTAGNISGTTAELYPKEWITVTDLLYGLMLPSGNDAALVLAENLGAFLYYMKKG